MRGVVGLDREILRCKAAGRHVVCEDGTPEYAAFERLVARGLLAIVAWREDAWAYTDVTPIGRVVLAVSEAS